MIEVREVTTPAQIHRIYQLRYDVYIEELRNHHPFADHQNRSLQDRLDACNPYNLAAFRDGRLVGSIRLHRLTDCRREDLTFFQIDDECWTEPDRYLLVSMLAVERSRRGGRAFVRLLDAALQFGLGRKALACFLFAERHNAVAYERLGWRFQRSSPLCHPIYRQVYPMVLDDLEAADRLAARLRRLEPIVSASSSSSNG